MLVRFDLFVFTMTLVSFIRWARYQPAGWSFYGTQFETHFSFSSVMVVVMGGCGVCVCGGGGALTGGAIAGILGGIIGFVFVCAVLGWWSRRQAGSA